MGKQIINGLYEVGGVAMFNKVLLTSFLTVFAVINVADATGGNVTVTSKDYVDNVAETKQVKIPSAGQSGVGIGDTVMTYTSGGNGAIGERGIFSGGTYTAGTDADKLITASALNAAIGAIPTTETSKLTCYDNDCTLWSIGTQTAYGNNSGGASAIDLSSLVDTNGTAVCYTSLDGERVSDTGCTTPRTNYGEWGTVFDVNNETIQISGISACSATYANQGLGTAAGDQSRIQSDYESNTATVPNYNPGGGYCYCKMTEPNTSGAQWVFANQATTTCAKGCAMSCANYARANSRFRPGLFGVQ